MKILFCTLNNYYRMPKAEMRIWGTLVTTLVLISEVSVRDYDTYHKFSNKNVFQGDFPTADSPVTKEVGKYYIKSGDLCVLPIFDDFNLYYPFQYVRHIYSMFDAYRREVGASTKDGARLVIETNALIDTKFKTWKRNADIINSLLALPQGMNNAGRQLSIPR